MNSDVTGGSDRKASQGEKKTTHSDGAQKCCFYGSKENFLHLQINSLVSKRGNGGSGVGQSL